MTYYKIKAGVLKKGLLFVLYIIGTCGCNSNQIIPSSVICNAYYYGEENTIQTQQITLHREWNNFWQTYQAFVSVGEQKISDVKKCSKRKKASNELERQYQYKFIFNSTWCYFDDVYKLFKYSEKL